MYSTEMAAGIALATALAGTASADGDEGLGDHGGQGVRMLAAIDADRDGKLTQAEIDKVRDDRKAAFAAHDSNRDGKLGLEEFAHLWRETMRPLPVRAFRRLGTDGDAVISGSEYDRPLAGVVQRLQRNDGGGFSLRGGSDRDDHDDHDDDHDE